MAHISQEIEVVVAQPGTTWRQDTTLPEPLLRFPLDESHFCPQILLMYGYSAGVTLYWTAVTGATFYVVQVGDNQSFSGPDVNGIKTTNTQLELDYLKDLRVGDQVFWRVAAYNTTGGFSVMSEVRSIKIACPNMKGIAYDAETGLYTSLESPQVCDNIGVDIQLLGPKTVRKTDSDRTFVLNVNYDCASLEGQAVTINSVIWEVRQSSSAPVTVADDTDQYLKLDIDSDKEEWFELVAHVLFNAGATTFECTKHHKVLIEGTPTSGGTPTISFEITDILRGKGLLCNAVEAKVLGVSCNYSGVSPCDIVVVWDGLLQAFAVPMELLIGVKGYATLMKTPDEYSTCLDFVEFNDGGIQSDRPCRWEVISLGCPEEVL